MKRRNFIRLACLSGLIPVLDLSAAPVSGEVSVEEQMAVSLNYVKNAKEAKGHARYQSGQLCSNCMFFNASNNGCALFSGRAVKPEGWCASWVKKPS